jgi:hypothetical protein
MFSGIYLIVTWNNLLRLDSEKGMQSPSTVSPSPAVTAAVQTNLVLLEQGRALIAQLGEARYGVRVPACFNSSAGGHFRHVIEHYQALVAAAVSGDLDYENRARDSLIETQADYADDVMDDLGAALLAISSRGVPDRLIRLASETTEGTWVMTSLARELEFLISHTVHHYALIAVIAGMQDVTLPADFGMAPSTLKFQRTQLAACAR